MFDVVRDGVSDARPVDEVDANIGLEAFHRSFVRPKHPVVLRGLMRGTAAARRWSPAYFRDEHGDARVAAYRMHESGPFVGRVVLDENTGFLLEHMSMRSYVDDVITPGRPHLYLRARLTSLPALDRELVTPALARARLGLRRNLWFGAARTVSSLHFDLPNNLVAQLYGKKRILIFDSRDRAALYPHSFWSAMPHVSQVDPEAPDLERWPRLANANPRVVTLEPGDVLYIPRRSWHHARALDVSISVNYWWCEARTYPVLLASDLYKKLRGLNI